MRRVCLRQRILAGVLRLGALLFGVGLGRVEFEVGEDVLGAVEDLLRQVGDEVARPGFLLDLSYLLVLVLFWVGVVFSSPWLAGAGLLGIAVFALGVFRQVRARKDRA